MKINQLGPSGMNPYKRQMNKLDQAANVRGKTEDKVEISATAKEMQQVSRVESQRQERVEELKIQVQNGQYKVQPKEVAKSIYNFYFKK